MLTWYFHFTGKSTTNLVPRSSTASASKSDKIQSPFPSNDYIQVSSLLFNNGPLSIMDLFPLCTEKKIMKREEDSMEFYESVII